MDVRYEVEQVLRTYCTRVGNSGPDNATCPCPFHTKSDGSPERSPSFAMNLSNGLFLCHSCGAKGNLYTFFRLLGLPREQIAIEFQSLIDAAKDNLSIVRDPATTALFDKSPLDHRVLGMLDYCPNDLLYAGFTERTLKDFEVGFDRWHQRTTYPIRDIAGQLVAISGRTVIDEHPRYKLYDKEFVTWGLPPREAWHRNKILYNMWKVYPELYHSTSNPDIILVEGFKACMWVHQAGFTNVAALLGHSLTDPQKAILEHTGGTIYLFLDNDPRAWDGCEDAGLRLAHSMDVRVMLYPDRIREDPRAQPDSCTAEEIQYQKGNAIDFWNFRQFRRETAS